MKRIFAAKFAFIAAALLAVSGITASQSSADNAQKLKVHLKYTGSGLVDDKHKVYVVVWDSADFVSNPGMPRRLMI